jgi:methyl-accepting chemotaxis protein
VILIARPLSAITATIKEVAEGADNVRIPHTGRGDEIGALSRRAATSSGRLHDAN